MPQKPSKYDFQCLSSSCFVGLLHTRESENYCGSRSSSISECSHRMHQRWTTVATNGNSNPVDLQRHVTNTCTCTKDAACTKKQSVQACSSMSTCWPQNNPGHHSREPHSGSGPYSNVLICVPLFYFVFVAAQKLAPRFPTCQG